MSLASLFPLGVLQLYHSVANGYWDARTLSYLGGTGNKVLEWVRLPGDVLFIIGGALPVLWLAWKAVSGGKRARPDSAELDVDLYTEVITPS